MSHDSNSKAHAQIFHKPRGFGQRLDSWDPDLRGPPKAIVPGPTPLFCRKRQPEQGGDSTKPHGMSGQRGLADKPMGRTGRRGHQQSLLSRSTSSACPFPASSAGERRGAGAPAGGGWGRLPPPASPLGLAEITRVALSPQPPQCGPRAQKPPDRPPLQPRTHHREETGQL